MPPLQDLERRVFQDTADALWSRVVLPAAAGATHAALLRACEPSQLTSAVRALAGVCGPCGGLSMAAKLRRQELGMLLAHADALAACRFLGVIARAPL